MHTVLNKSQLVFAIVIVCGRDLLALVPREISAQSSQLPFAQCFFLENKVLYKVKVKILGKDNI